MSSGFGWQRNGWVIAGIAFAFCFALVPLYNIACEHVLGIKMDQGATDASEVAGMQVDTSRWVTVQFIANTHSKLPWRFNAEKVSMQVHPGELSEAFFDATNTSDRAIVGNAVPSVAPNTASLYFNKTECFCFTEQLLNAGETRRMPVRFIIDPRLPKDIGTVTLAYSFVENDIATKKLAESNQAAVPAT
ncbi:cytochrome c oxidase assembly protein [Tahibacter amnicola]|uniref:Cytochrome c oxidase assembly protein CtaG n=1 Tax=Tahibacter amnicola TaxID=2976241 RepID=A0ABY6BFV6_9GAMM|nr:cytochrome c oxidase assembly protein [Tahibacter amnicola]UXI68649.1 cytochrome c oxidase assembly protein [Tahibacter amnicola]